MKFYWLIVALLFSTPAIAKEIYYGSNHELVNISKETIFRFHQQVRTISEASKFEIKPADSNDPDYSMLSIRPRFSKGTSNVVFVLTDGSLVKLKLRITRRSGEPFYDLIPKSQLIERSKKNLPSITVIDFMKSINSDSEVIGYKRKRKDNWVNTRGIKGVKARLIREYSGKDYKGFVIELRNKYKTVKYKLHPEKLRFLGAKLTLVTLIDDEILYPKSKTLIKVVAKSSARVKDLVLPIETIKEVKKEKKPSNSHHKNKNKLSRKVVKSANKKR